MSKQSNNDSTNNRRFWNLIDRQIVSISRRSESLPLDHPAKAGILKTIERLSEGRLGMDQETD
jgi:hypothetical protein